MKPLFTKDQPGVTLADCSMMLGIAGATLKVATALARSTEGGMWCITRNANQVCSLERVVEYRGGTLCHKYAPIRWEDLEAFLLTDGGDRELERVRQDLSLSEEIIRWPGNYHPHALTAGTAPLVPST
jgi:hypothetical protein